MSRSFIEIAAIAALLTIGCGNKEAETAGAARTAGAAPTTAAPSAKDVVAAAAKPAGKLDADPADSPGVADAKRTFKMQCAQCHGNTGQGDGPAAAQLNPKPRNYTDKSWQQSVSDDEIRAIIFKGGAAVGKSALMPANPALEKKPETLDGLVEVIRSFAD